MNQPRWMPASVRALHGYSWSTFAADLGSGVTVGLVALPLAMAFAIASGVAPEAGIYCAVVTGFLISALGGSKFQIGGPTGAFVVVVAGIIASYGMDGLFMCTMMAGGLLVILGVTGMGTAVKYLPRPVVIGFTNGIAILIASTQIRDFFGLQVGPVPSDFSARMALLARHAATVSPAATAFGGRARPDDRAASLRPGTGAIVALVLGTGPVLFAAPIDTIGRGSAAFRRDRPHSRIPSSAPT